MSSEDQQIYFEKQGRFSNNCAVHTINNLIGFPAFSAKTLDEICSILQSQAKLNGFTTKTRHMMGGDYDINVIQKALQNLALQATWVDSRVNYVYKYEKGTFPKGYILNFHSEENMFQKMLSYSNRHWICVKLQCTDYYMLDSKKPEPILIEDIDYFINRMREDGCQILEVRGRIDDNKKGSTLINDMMEPKVLLQSESEEDKQILEEKLNQQLQNNKCKQGQGQQQQLICTSEEETSKKEQKQDNLTHPNNDIQKDAKNSKPNQKDVNKQTTLLQSLNDPPTALDQTHSKY